GLFYSDIIKLLTEFIVGKPLDLPFHALCGMRTLCIGRAKHHNGMPPPPIECILSHFFLYGCSLCQRHHDFISLTVVKAFFLTYANPGSCIWAIRCTA